MKDNILDLIREKYHSLNSAEKKAASFVLANCSRVERMSINELALGAQVSEATVTRFCKSLSLPGFFAFKLELAKACDERIPRRDGENTRLKDGILQDARSAIEETVALASKEKIESAVSMIEKAERVIAVGYGTTALAAKEFVSIFSRASLKFFSVEDVHTQMASLALLTEKDLLVLFSYSGATVEGAELLKYAKDKNIPTLLITHFERSPSSQFADAVISYAVDEHPYSAGSVPVRIAQLTLMDMLWREYERRNGQSCYESMQRVTDAIAKKHI